MQIETSDITAIVSQAVEMLKDPEREYELREFLRSSGLFRIHDYEKMGDRPIGTHDCGSVRLEDTPKSLYRALFLFQPESLSFTRMYKGILLTLVSPDYQLMATVEFFKYELAIYFAASKEHVGGRESGVICGLPGANNGIEFKTQIAEQWFGLIENLLNHEWDVYGGNNFSV